MSMNVSLSTRACSIIFRSLEAAHHASSSAPRSRAKATAFFHTSRKRQQESKSSRYGTANELPPHLKGKPAEDGKKSKLSEPKVAAAEDGKKSKSSEPKVTAAEASSAPTPPEPVQTTIELPPPPEEPVQTILKSDGQDDGAVKDPKAPLDRVIDMEPPSQAEDEDKLPHLQAPRYVHHFDTFSLVRDLQKGGFTENQTVDIMKAIRGLLGENMNLARRALVSKSNVENETYLFRAACSELKTEIQNNRKSEGEKWRTQRAQLQHEVDILSQNMTQEIASLKDELRGIFDDRKMNVRMQQKTLDGEIQELNYKITVALNSDARGTIEGIRWILTRRAATALAFGALMVIGSLNYSRYMIATQEAERKKHAKDMAQQEQIQTIIERGSTHGLAEEVLLGPEGVSGG